MLRAMLLIALPGLWLPAFAETSPNIKPSEKPRANDIGNAKTADSSAAEKAAPKQDDPFEMLQQAYYAGGQLPADQHAYQMAALVVLASKIHDFRLDQWAQEALQLSQGLPQKGMRPTLENGVLSSLADVDSAAALKLLSQLQPPSVTGFETLSVHSDLRTIAARSIFPSYWKGTKTPDTEALRSAADYLGETGEYPFAALALILSDINARDSSVAQMFFLDAVQYYERDQPRSFDSHYQFLDLLKKGQGLMPDPMEQSAIQVAVSKLLKLAGAPLPNDMVYVGRIGIGDGFVELQSPAEETLYRLLPLVRQLAPELEKEILEKRAGLSRITPSDIGPVPAGYSEIGISMLASAQDGKSIDLSQDPAKRAELLTDLTNQNRAGGARRLAATDPELALKLANSITEPALKASALAAVAQGKLKDTDPAQAAKLMADVGVSGAAKPDFSEPDARAQLAALVASVRSLSQRDDPGLWPMLNRGLDFSEEQFVQQRQASKNPNFVGYVDASDWQGPVPGNIGPKGGPGEAFLAAVALVRIGMEKETANTLGWLAQQHDPAAQVLFPHRCRRRSVEQKEAQCPCRFLNSPASEQDKTTVSR